MAGRSKGHRHRSHRSGASSSQPPQSGQGAPSRTEEPSQSAAAMAGFDPSVSRAVGGLPVWVSSLWREEGVESLIDLALLYRDQPALQQHLQEVAQAEGRTDALEEDVRAATEVWADARRRCPDAIATLAASIRATPGSSSGTGGLTRAASPGTHGQQYASKRIREAVPGPESSGSPPRFAGPPGELTQQAPGALPISGPVIDRAYAVCLEAREAGSKWLPFAPSPDLPFPW